MPDDEEVWRTRAPSPLGTSIWTRVSKPATSSKTPEYAATYGKPPLPDRRDATRRGREEEDRQDRRDDRRRNESKWKSPQEKPDLKSAQEKSNWKSSQEKPDWKRETYGRKSEERYLYAKICR